MSMQSILNLILEKYPLAVEETFTEHEVADLVRQQAPASVREMIAKDDRYIIRGSAGQGNWAKVPWFAVFDRLVTTTAEEGYYVVYLVREDCTGVYISLNQGVTEVRSKYGADAAASLRARGSDFLAQLGSVGDRYIQGPIDLRTTTRTSLGYFYEQGSICAILYERGTIPDDGTLEADLKSFMKMYHLLALKGVLPTDTNSMEDDEEGCGEEDLTRIRAHKRIERNWSLARKAKRILGYRCQACGFSFEAIYGDVGKEYIEAHHLVPLSDLAGERVKLKPERDFAVLCANCHRMIHRSESVSNVEEFAANHIKELHGKQD